MAERSGIHVTGHDSGWPVGGSAEGGPKKDGSGKDDLPEVTAVQKGVVVSDEETQQATVTGEAGTTFKLTLSGQTTSALAKGTATAAEVKAALEALSNVAPGDVAVEGPAGGPWLIRFLEGGAFDGDNVPAITGTGIGVNEVETVTISGSPSGGNFKLTFGGQTTGNLKFDATGAEVQTALRALSTIADDEVSVSGNGPYAVTFTAGLGAKDVAALTADGSGLTGGTTPKVTVTTGTPGKPAPTVEVVTLAEGED